MINRNNEFINILNVPLGNSVAVKELFKKKIEVIQHEFTRLRKLHSTFDAKVMVMLVFLTKVNCFLCNFFATLNDAILRYFIGFHKSITMNETSKKDGRYGVMEIPLYMQLFFVKHIKQYIEVKTESGSWPLHLFFMEYYCGSWLFKTVNIPLSNLVPHAFKPYMYYQQYIDAFSRFNQTWSSIDDYDCRDIYELIIGQRNRQI